MADCTVITTELDDTLITESGLELVTENSVCPGDAVVAFQQPQGILLRPLERPLQGLHGF